MRQLRLDPGLPRQQPVHGGVQLVFVRVLDVQESPQARLRRLRGHRPGGGELGAGGEDPRHDHGDHEIALTSPPGRQECVEAERAQGPEDGHHVAVGQAAHALEAVVRRDERLAREDAADGVERRGRQVGEVAECLVFDRAVFAVGASQEVCFIDAVFIPAPRGGYMNGSASR